MIAIQLAVVRIAIQPIQQHHIKLFQVSMSPVSSSWLVARMQDRTAGFMPGRGWGQDMVHDATTLHVQIPDLGLGGFLGLILVESMLMKWIILLVFTMKSI